MLPDPAEYREKVFAWAEAAGIKTVRLVIVQPEVNDEATEYQMPLAELEEFAKTLHQGIDRCRRAETAFDLMPREEWNKVYLHPDPTDDVCRWCKAQATCPAVRAKLERSAKIDFHAMVEHNTTPIAENYTTIELEEAMLVVPLLESLSKAIRAEMERRMFAGEEMKHFGLELGRKGNRKWKDPAAIQALLRGKMRLRIEDVFEMSLRSPPQLENLTRPGVDDQGRPINPTIGKRQWAKIEDHITRADAKPSVKLKSRIKEAYIVEKPTAEGFMPVEESDDEDLSA